MEPLHQFVIDLEQFFLNRGYVIRSSQDIDLCDAVTGKLIGYWPSTVDAESFRELKS